MCQILALAVAAAAGAEELYELRGQLVPARAAVVGLNGVNTPYQHAVLADAGGRFRVKGLVAGSYTVAIILPGRGEVRQTIEVSPSFADKKRRVNVVLRVDEAKMATEPQTKVSMKDLVIPKDARKAYQDAERALKDRDGARAVALLERAVQLAPGYAMAWNHLGTLAYQRREFPQAEAHFRRSLEADADAYEPLVNMGGVLLNLDRPAEAWEYNVRAVARRRTDALAHSQLGMTYFALGRMDLAEKSLQEARRLDAGHFSHPQLLLAEICLRQGRGVEAADHLEDFLAHHPDWPKADVMRDRIRELRRQSSGTGASKQRSANRQRAACSA